MEKILIKSKQYNIGIFTPWCDQGLGIQSRNYYNILKKSDLYRTFIFAVKPYNADSCQDLQKNKEEWIVPDIYYSPNCREDVKDSELIKFVTENNIGKMLIPETCWNRIFEIGKLLKEHNVKVYAIPNIEIVRKDEICKHNVFYKILGNNYLCENIFKNHLSIPVEYIGYAYVTEGIKSKEKIFNDDNIIKYLFIGGMNAFSRKNILLVCEGFVMAYEKNNNIRLTCSIQKNNLLEENIKKDIEKYFNHPAITIINNHLSHEDIINLYYTSHISIQVSKHEGLGLGFYEGISTGTPVLTLNTPPHNEIIIDNENGWVIDCYHKLMTDNKDPIFDSAYFYPNIFADKILEISSKELIQTICENIRNKFSDKIMMDLFINRIMTALN
jgi:glycosyltransferase involved in cell wall biosynthesis